MAKHVFITGGVVSSLGRGSLGRRWGDYSRAAVSGVVMQKFDPYLNVDPGTMSPFQHGEVFVTEDSAETDLDLGHYGAVHRRQSHTRRQHLWFRLQRHTQGTTGRLLGGVPFGSFPMHQRDQRANRPGGA